MTGKKNLWSRLSTLGLTTFFLIFLSGICFAAVPTLVSFTPDLVSTTVGDLEVFTLVLEDEDGWEDIARTELYIYIPGSAGGLGFDYDAIKVEYRPEGFLSPTDRVSMYRHLEWGCPCDWLGGVVGTPGLISEDYLCAFDIENTTIVGDGNTLTIEWHLYPKVRGTGIRGVDLRVGSSNDETLDWTGRIATWNVLCSDDASCDDGLYCNGVETCGVDNFCEPGTDPCVPLACHEDTDTCVGCTDDNDCGFCEKCDTEGNCIPQDPGEDLKGDCLGACSTGCDGAGDCGVEPDTTECRPSAGECDVEETCDGISKECPSDKFTLAGTACADDGNDCTYDECDGVGACIHPPLADGTSCDDGMYCTQSAECQGGQCTGSGNPCTDDGLFCNGVEYCDEDNDSCESPGSPCQPEYSCNETNDKCVPPTPPPPPPTTTTTSAPVTPSCDVVIAPSSETVKSGDTVEFTALTTCDEVEVEGSNYLWEVESTLGSSIDENTGLYTAGDNNTDDDVTDTILVTDTANGNVTATASVTVEEKVTPPVCDTVIEPSVSTIDSEESLTFTATTEGEGCLEPDYTWDIDTEIHSEITFTPGSSTCYYQAGSNKTGVILTDTITVIDNANGTSTNTMVNVLYGRIVRVLPDALFHSRWIPLPHFMIIIGENTRFNATSHPVFIPDDSITIIGHIASNNLMCVLLLLSPNPEGGFVDLEVTTTNGAGQEVTFSKMNALTNRLLPSILDESTNKP